MVVNRYESEKEKKTFVVADRVHDSQQFGASETQTQSAASRAVNVSRSFIGKPHFIIICQQNTCVRIMYNICNIIYPEGNITPRCVR